MPWPKHISSKCIDPNLEIVAASIAAELAGHGQGSITLRLTSREMPREHYRLVFDEHHIQVTAGDEAGFRHARQTLRQLATRPFVPAGEIDDGPGLALRGFHLNLQNCRRLDAHQAVNFIETAARYKLNAILVEYGARFPFRSHESIVDAAAVTPGEIETLNARAAACGVRLIPLQQSLAHLEYALADESLAYLRERPDKPNLMCPADPAALELFKSLAGEIMAAHPDAPWFHIGGDEARKFGHCPRCADLVRQHGHGEVFGRYVAKVARWVLEQGKRPIIWDDTLCAHPSAIDHLPKETIIMYWDYIAVADPTPVLIPRMAHATGGPRVAHDWSWFLRRRRGRVSDVQADVMRTYSKPARLKSALGAEYVREFGKYLGDGFPQWIRALPYLEYYQDRGHDVITAPTGMGNGDTTGGLPNFARFEDNIRTHAARCKQNGRALGLITTAWYDVPPEMLHRSLLLTAQLCW